MCPFTELSLSFLVPHTPAHHILLNVSDSASSLHASRPLLFIQLTKSSKTILLPEISPLMPPLVYSTVLFRSQLQHLFVWQACLT